ncbi:homeobox transcription factor [Blumeria hordei DH14]|uniref:Homeobox transcription factor n=1 Tax=Blumeria graminis f. sp. hordei (strain DH14) TaxID=546991 RepID=N1JCP1_BLUG1|nr:homeobox transcription factor [Blumeria hordei DH14]
MLVARQCDTGRTTWSPTKLQAIYNTFSSRMSNFELPTTQPDWREQYAVFPSTGENSLLSTSFEQRDFSGESYSRSDQTSSQPTQTRPKSLGVLDLNSQIEPANNHRRWNPGDCLDLSGSSTAHFPLVLPEKSADIALTPLEVESTISVQTRPKSLGSIDRGSEVEIKDEEYDIEDDDDMLDAEFEENSAPSQMTAERRADRRKMKRFRLTHQQTRFLMSEFAKQAHPDAAHRERLSREIPGLSPRQVQVWFQNRRAKIKRLTADDRERMIKMRAVPDDFDSIQALHSPYGAVQAVETSLQSPAEIGQSYPETLLQPITSDTYRKEKEGHLSSTPSPVFSHMAFNPITSINSPDVMSSNSLSSPDQYYSNHLSNSLSVVSQTTNSHERPHNYSSLAQSGQSQNNARSQPMNFRESMLKTRPNTMRYPLRVGMSWSEDSRTYPEHQARKPSSQVCNGQSSLGYAEFSNAHGLNSHQYDINSYINTSNVRSSPVKIFPPPPGNPLLIAQNNPSSSRGQLRNTASTFSQRPSQCQYQVGNQSCTISSRNNSFGNNFTAGGYVNSLLTPFPAPSQDFLNSNDSTLSSAGPEQVNADFDIQSVQSKR